MRRTLTSKLSKYLEREILTDGEIAQYLKGLLDGYNMGIATAKRIVKEILNKPTEVEEREKEVGKE